MNLLDKYSCILCKYRKYNKEKDFGCWEARELDEHGYPIGECYSLSNIYYGTIINFFPFKQIHGLVNKIAWEKKDKYAKEMDEEYGDYALENDEFKFIWGVKSWDDLCDSDANMFTMNDIDLTYDKKKNEYMLGVETAYMFKDYAAECKYLKECLDVFTKYMDDNGLSKNESFKLFFGNPCTSMTAESIEELYTNFRIFVLGYCALEDNIN